MIREAASVILLRRTAPSFDVFLVRRHTRATFMASSFVFPGGVAELGEDARTTAARELREEAGVTVSTAALVPWAHWITPSLETPRRYSAQFFVTELPPGQEPKFDAVETIDQVWVTPREAIARAGELQLPPPQIRTCWELAELATLDDVLAAGHARASEPHPIMPRVAPGERPCLLLPWDPEYDTRGVGEASPLTFRPSWARGPSRFVLEGKTWLHVDAPSSTPPG